MQQGAIIKIISWLLVAFVLIAGIGAIAHFTGDITTEQRDFYISVDGKKISTTAADYDLSPDAPITVKVNDIAPEGATSPYSVKVIPNALSGKDFDFTLDGEVYSFQAESDLTAGFDIEYSESSFTIAPKGSLNAVMAAVYPNSTLSDISNHGYKNMFLLVVESADKSSTVTLAFSIPENVKGIQLTPDHIYF